VHGLSSLVGIFAAVLPNFAGMVLAGAITTVGCVAFHAIGAAGRKQSVEMDVVVGGLVIAGILGGFGLILVVAGLPAFK
jgi:hypothetical protein